MIWELKIRKVENGFVCCYKEEIEDDKFVDCEHLIIESDDINEDERFNEKKAIINVLWYVTEHFGVCNNSDDKNRIMINLQTRTWNNKKEDWGEWKNASEN